MGEHDTSRFKPVTDLESWIFFSFITLGIVLLIVLLITVNVMFSGCLGDEVNSTTTTTLDIYKLQMELMRQRCENNTKDDICIRLGFLEVTTRPTTTGVTTTIPMREFMIDNNTTSTTSGSTTTSTTTAEEFECGGYVGQSNGEWNHTRVIMCRLGYQKLNKSNSSLVRIWDNETAGRINRSKLDDLKKGWYQ